MNYFTFLVSVVALLASILAIVVIWRKSGAIEGGILEKLKNQHEWIQGHEARILGMESKKYITIDDHTTMSNTCVTWLNQKIDDTKNSVAAIAAAQVAGEKERYRIREIDNQRWSEIKSTLSAVLEFMEEEKRRRGHHE